MILFKWEIYVSGLVLYETLKWVFVCVWRLFVWYYLNDGLYVSECALYDIILWEIYVSGLVLYDTLKWVFVCVWRLFAWYYLNDGLYVSLCALYDIILKRDLCAWIGFIWNIKMSVCMCLKALCMILFKWWPVCVSKRFIWYYWNESFMRLDWFYMKY